MDSIKSYKTMVSSVSQTHVLLIGPVGAGKSSFFNSVNSVFRGHVTSQAMSGSSSRSLTTQFRTYSVRDGWKGKAVPIALCDTMGLEEATEAGLDLDDLSSILKGHMPDRYQFNPSFPLRSHSPGFRASISLKDKIHCVAFVMDACKVKIMSPKLEEKMSTMRQKINQLGVPQMVLLTKVDEACPEVAENTSNVYHSRYIQKKIHEAGACLGIPVSYILPIRNYSTELELDTNTDILILSGLVQMLRFTDNYFGDIGFEETCD